MKTIKKLPGLVIKVGSNDKGDFKEYFFLVEMIPSKLSSEWKALLRLVLFVMPSSWRNKLARRWKLDES